MATEMKKPGLFSRRVTRGATIGAALLFFILGIIFWGGFNTAMEVTNTMEFCTSCHEMEENVYQEYKPTIHHSNRTGVRATCSDCHVPDPWIHKMVRKVQASKEVLHKVLGTIDTPEKFENHRLELAKNVWKTMKKTDSRECRNCHNFESMNPAYQQPRARQQHLNAFETGQTCIDCHKGIAHKNVRDLLSEEELEELEKPDPAFVREVPQLYLDGMKLAEQRDQEAEEKEAAEKAKRREQKKQAAAATQQRIDEAVDKAVDKAVKAALASAAAAAPAVATSETTQADTAAPVETAPAEAVEEPAASGSAEGIGVDWSNAPVREITLLYPGQSSMEWMLTGKDHGGARPFIKMGDRCTTCHDKEADKMGQKIVTGEKLEPAETLIPGKRGSIPVTVQAMHDDENLYMRFEWENSEHTPAPFIDGGKMDPDNPMKLAIMFATDDVKYASQSGCWGTCHHDMDTMPHNPGEQVTKYITESRSKVEIKGRRGKKRGGWDKRKEDADIQSELEQGHFMDLLRYKSGKSETEDGDILADRVMEGGQGTEFTAALNGGFWVVEMKRKLQSDKPGDVSMALDKLYNFGFAIHDDYTNARFHHVSLGYRLGFDNDEAEVNAVKR
ncbi:MAG: NapC/NirT family cytochrome c [Pseudomonadota bacterium]